MNRRHSFRPTERAHTTTLVSTPFLFFDSNSIPMVVVFPPRFYWWTWPRFYVSISLLYLECVCYLLTAKIYRHLSKSFLLPQDIEVDGRLMFQRFQQCFWNVCIESIRQYSISTCLCTHPDIIYRYYNNKTKHFSCQTLAEEEEHESACRHYCNTIKLYSSLLKIPFPQ